MVKDKEMMEAGKYQTRETLKNGLQVTVRAIRPDDRDALLKAFNSLDEKTIYLRFFGPKRGLSPRELAEATEVDFVRTVALVTCLQDGQEEKIIGAGRYIAFGAAEPPDRAEVAFTVAEDYRGLGIAGMTLRHLAGIAKRQGIARFQAEVLPENKGMLTVFNRSGLPLRQDYADGLVHVTLSLDRFMAEAYWDLEWELQQQGFDYCYDKRLYDRLEHGSAESVRLHLCADLSFQKKLVRFIENHDEPRALAAFSPRKAHAAAVTTAFIPGAKLFHEGQFEGRKVRLPVFLGRRPVEEVDHGLQDFYRTLLKLAGSEGLRHGRWQLCERTDWPDNASCLNLVAWCWRSAGDCQLIVVNLSAAAAQGLVLLPWDELRGRTWRMTDLFSQKEYERSGDELCSQGLYVDLPPWGYHVLTHWLPLESPL